MNTLGGSTLLTADIDGRCSPRFPGARPRTCRERHAAEAQPPPGGARGGGARRGVGCRPRPRRPAAAVAAPAGGGHHLTGGHRGFGGRCRRGAAGCPAAVADRGRTSATTVDEPAAPAVGRYGADTVDQARHHRVESADPSPVVIAPGHTRAVDPGFAGCPRRLATVAGTVDAHASDGVPQRRPGHLRRPGTGTGPGDADRPHRRAARPARPSRTGATGVGPGARERAYRH